MRAAAARRTRRRRARAVVGLIALTSCGAGWVDPDSPSSAQSTTEIGGSDEEAAAAYLRDNTAPKPVVAYVAGLQAPTERRMGHAGTLSVFGSGSAATKNAALKSAGVCVVQNVDDVAQAMAGTMAAA